MPQQYLYSQNVREIREVFGDRLCAALDDPTVAEIMLNPDGKLFIEWAGQGMAPAGKLTKGASELIINCVARMLNTGRDEAGPIISGEIPMGGHRFEGLLPPIVSGPCFSIRTRSSPLILLDQYVDSKSMTAEQASTIRNAVESRINIVVSGEAGAGKTTLAQAIAAEIPVSCPDDRLVILEDSLEIRCAAENAVALLTSDKIDMRRLLKTCMRLRPDRIIVGEITDGAALALLKAWTTACPGGVTTISCSSARSALTRFEQLTAEVCQQPMHDLIGDAVDLIVPINRTARGWRVEDIQHVEGFKNGRYQIESCEYSGPAPDA